MRPLLGSLFLALILGHGTACGDDEATSIEPPAASPDASYTVRGRIADVTGDEVSIQHEAIEDFRDREGEVVGMATMTMAFHKPEELSMEGISVDDLVRFTFDVTWEGSHPMTLREIEKLPADTVLEL